MTATSQPRQSWLPAEGISQTTVIENVHDKQRQERYYQGISLANVSILCTALVGDHYDGPTTMYMRVSVVSAPGNCSTDFADIPNTYVHWQNHKPY